MLVFFRAIYWSFVLIAKVSTAICYPFQGNFNPGYKLSILELFVEILFLHQALVLKLVFALFLLIRTFLLLLFLFILIIVLLSVWLLNFEESCAPIFIDEPTLYYNILLPIRFALLLINQLRLQAAGLIQRHEIGKQKCLLRHHLLKISMIGVGFALLDLYILILDFIA